MAADAVAEAAADAAAGSALAFMLRLSCLFGTAPLNLGAHESVLWTRLYYAHAMYRVVVIITLSITGISRFVMEIILNIQNTDNAGATMGLGPLRKVQSISLLIHYVLTVIIVIVGAWTGRDRMSRIFENYRQIKEAHLRLNTRDKKKRREAKRIVASFLVLVTNILLLISSLKKGLDHHHLFLVKKGLVVYAFSTNLFLYIAGISLLLETVLFMYTFRDTVEFLNEEVKQMLNDFHSTRPLTVAEENRLRYISTTYLRICEKVSQFNQADGCFLLLQLFYYFQRLLFTINANIDLTFIGAYSDFAVESIKWTLLHTAYLVALVEPCYQFQKEVEKLRVLIRKMVLRTHVAGERSALTVHVFVQQLTHDAPTFTPLGICTVSRSLLSTVTSTAITCLFFLVQLRMKHKEDS